MMKQSLATPSAGEQCPQAGRLPTGIRALARATFLCFLNMVSLLPQAIDHHTLPLPLSPSDQPSRRLTDSADDRINRHPLYHDRISLPLQHLLMRFRFSQPEVSRKPVSGEAPQVLIALALKTPAASRKTTRLSLKEIPASSPRCCCSARRSTGALLASAAQSIFQNRLIQALVANVSSRSLEEILGMRAVGLAPVIEGAELRVVQRAYMEALKVAYTLAIATAGVAVLVSVWASLTSIRGKAVVGSVEEATERGGRCWATGG